MVSHHALAIPRNLVRRTLRSGTRSYFSHEHPDPPPFTPAEDAILSAGISHVPAHGFTTTALANGARDAGYLDASVNLFPSGAFALVKYHLVTQRLALSHHTSPPSPNGESPNISDKVRNLALARLHANKSVIHRWQEAIALSATPQHLSSFLRELALLSDEIHFLAGDTSVDTSWYTKRAGLSAIYASTELFMTQDQSLNFKETEKFLDRRLEGAQGLKSAVEETGRWIGVQGMGILNGLRSKGVRI